MPSVVLSGCSPEPLMGYLKALGVFRLVAEQADPKARGSWEQNAFVLESTLDRKQLQDFFLNRYRPTPVLAPWNGGSGFYGGGADPLIAISASTVARLSDYRDAIALIRDSVLNGIEEKPTDESKDALLMRCRAQLPDNMVTWLDCCFVLGEDCPGYFPLLGTGGNDGRLDFTNNFMQRLEDVIAFDEGETPADSPGWLDAAIFSEGMTALGRSAIGQFNPGGIGGANGVQGRFEADARVNPWDFVFMIEGAMIFAGSLARRLGASGSSKSAFPFSVETIAVGYGSATTSEETTDGSRAELWLPLWSAPARLAEINNLFGEGRAQVGKRQAKNAVEFAVAVSLLGVNRGVTAFSRYGFLKRNGLALLAAPLGRMAVTHHPDARLLEDRELSDWIDRLRSACRDKDRTPARYLTALRQIDQAIFRFANRSETGKESDHGALVEVLRALGRAERTLAGGQSFCADKFIRPLQRLNPDWLKQANDGSAEFRLAASVAGIEADGDLPSLRAYLEPCEARGDYASWDAGSTSAVWSKRNLSDNFAAVFRQRQLEAFRAGRIGVPLRSRWTPRLADIDAFLHDEADDEKLEELLWAFTGIRWSAVEASHPQARGVLPFEFAVPRLLAQRANIRAEGNSWTYSLTEGEANVRPSSDVYSALASSRPDAVACCVDHAARRLEMGGLVVAGRRNRKMSGRSLISASPIPSQRILAAMLFPLSPDGLAKIAYDVLSFPEREE